MLTDEEKQEIDHELSHYDYKQGACIDALKIVQRHRGWISDDSLKDIADYLGMSVDQLDNVATFYNLIFRKPVGKHVILLCDSVSCWICGYDGIRKRINEKLGIDFGQTTSDNQFTLLPIQCLGTCDHAPAFMIDDELFNDLTIEKVDAIFDEYKSGKRGNGTTTH